MFLAVLTKVPEHSSMDGETSYRTNLLDDEHPVGVISLRHLKVLVKSAPVFSMVSNRAVTSFLPK